MAGYKLTDFVKEDDDVIIDDDTGIEAAIGDGNIPVEETLTEQAMSMGGDAVKFITEAPETIRKAFTGEDIQVEYELPELTDIPSDEAGFFETFIPNIKLMFARNDFSKAEIIENEFGDDKRFGGVHKDKFNNPIIVWNNKPYYVNKAGASIQDLGTVAGDVVKYTPAGKMVGLTSTVGGKVLTGLPAYTATEAGGQIIENLLAPKTATKIDKRTIDERAKDALKMGGLATALDVAVPPVLRAGGKVIKETAKGTANIAKKAGANIPNLTNFLNKSKDGSKSVFELTQAQRKNKPYDSSKGQLSGQRGEGLDAEDYIRNTTNPTLQGEKSIIQGFDAKQLGDIQNTARNLQSKFGTGEVKIGPEAQSVPLVAGENIKGILTKSRDQLKQSSDDAYLYVEQANRPPLISKDGVINFRDKLLNTIRKENIDKVDLPDYKFITKQLKFLGDLTKKINKEGYAGDTFELLKNARLRLNRQIETTINTNRYEASVLIKLKNNVDEVLFDNFDKGFISGDKMVVDQLKKATNDYADYMKLGGQGRGSKYNSDNHANKILEKITDPNLRPKDVVNVFFGHNKFAPPSTMNLVLNKIKQVIPEDQYNQVILNVKDAILEKAFAGSGKSGITRTQIVNNYKDVFIENADIMKNIFNKSELKQIKEFKDNVLPTLWAEIKNNPSGTAYTIPIALHKTGLLSTILKKTPIIGEGGALSIAPAVESIQSASSKNIVEDMIAQYTIRKTKPLFNFPIPKLGVKVLEGDKQGITTGAKESLIDEPELDTSGILDISNTTNPIVAKKIIEAAR